MAVPEQLLPLNDDEVPATEVDAARELIKEAFLMPLLLQTSVEPALVSATEELAVFSLPPPASDSLQS